MAKRTRKLLKTTVVDASEVGLAPGLWPDRIIHNGLSWRTSEGGVVLTEDGDDVQAVHYQDIEGNTLIVLND
jgi:hypothetical protein